jgi:hypothetical protein
VERHFAKKDLARHETFAIRRADERTGHFVTFWSRLVRQGRILAERPPQLCKAPWLLLWGQGADMTLFFMVTDIGPRQLSHLWTEGKKD